MKPTHARYWVVAFALALAMIMYIQRVAISQAIVPISADLHLDKRQTGIVLGAFGLSYALFEIPMGLLGDKLGVRPQARASEAQTGSSASLALRSHTASSMAAAAPAR